MDQNLNEGFRSIEIRAMQAVLEDEFIIQRNDADNLKRVRHKLKSSSLFAKLNYKIISYKKLYGSISMSTLTFDGTLIF